MGDDSLFPRPSIVQRRADDVDVAFLEDLVLLSEKPELALYRAGEAAAKRSAQRKFYVMKARLVQRFLSGAVQSVRGQCFQWLAGRLQVDNDAVEELLVREYAAELAERTSANALVRGYAVAWLLRRYGSSRNLDDGKMLRLQCPSVFLTYQGSWGLLPSSDIPLVTASMNIDGVAGAVRTVLQLQALRDSLQGFCRDLQQRRLVQEYAWALELCPSTWQSVGELRVHAHVYLLCNGSVCMRRSDLRFLGSRPVVQHNISTLVSHSAGSRRGRLVNYAGAYYASVAKIGQICNGGTVLPHRDYPVRDTWITGLFVAGKITGEVAEQEYTSCVLNVERNVRQLRFVMRVRRERLVEQLRSQRIQSIQASLGAFRSVATVASWMESFLTIRDRYKFLVLDGPSRMGKTRYACSLVPTDKVFYCDCSNGNPPDLREFCRTSSELILFDELTASMAVSHKKLLQSSSDVCKLGCSPTQQHCYDVFLGGARCVVATNTWWADVKQLSDEDAAWLWANCVYVYVDTPLWIEPPERTERETELSMVSDTELFVSPTPLANANLSPEVVLPLSQEGDVVQQMGVRLDC